MIVGVKQMPVPSPSASADSDARHTERMVPGTEKWRMGWAEHITRYIWSVQNLKAGARVLDIGCGVGYGSKYLAEHGAGQIVAVDYSDQALEQARHEFHHPAITYLQDDAQLLSHVDGQFDLIVAFEIYEHIPHPEKMLARCAELLAPSGQFCCGTPNARFRPTLADGITPRNPFHVREYSAAEFRDTLSRHFASVELFGQDFVPAYNRLREVLSRLEEMSQRRDFAVWSNPFVRLGRFIQRLRGAQIDWPTQSGHIYPPHEQDVVIQNSDIEQMTTLLARCRNAS
jgi:SAM-dependent methyltransferase